MSEVEVACADRVITFAKINVNDRRRFYYQSLGSVYQARREAHVPELIQHCHEVNRIREKAVAMRDEMVNAGFSNSADEDDSELAASSDIEEFRDVLQEIEQDD